LNGEISDLTIETAGGAIFTSVSENATVKNVTVNVNADVTTTENNAFVALENYGLIEDVTVNVSGKINAVAPSNSETSNEIVYGGIVQYNGNIPDIVQTIYGWVRNCTVNYSGLTLKGETHANATFAGVVGINDGVVYECTVNGEITADTFDISGVCLTNNYYLSGNVNRAKLSQTASDTGWNPIVCGIVSTNTFVVEKCENRGDISSISTCGEVEQSDEYDHIASAAGIAYLNRSSMAGTAFIRECANSGRVESSAKYRNAYSAGICLSTNGAIESCRNSGYIAASADNDCDMYVGGIAAFTYGYVYKAISEGAVSANGNGTAYIGGISALSRAQILSCYASGDVSAAVKSAYAGGIFGYSEGITNSNSSIRGGVAEYCIREGKLNIKATDGNKTFVGGIAGYINEVEMEGKAGTYNGGGVINSFFAGECTFENAYFGAIVGVCGAHIYETNSYTVSTDMGAFIQTAEYHNFVGNYYAENVSPAFGGTVDGDNFAQAEGKGATPASVENMQNSSVYKSILTALGIQA
ncbi:MAG: hypothetical protein K2M36_03040, partial [Clostridia bacterium]|nr:hypothetical protein [Clostridia bacterium]